MDPHTTELIWFRSHRSESSSNTQHFINESYHNVIQGVNAVHDLGVTLDCKTMSTKSVELASITFDN